MRASGIPWLGDVPESWELQRVKALVDNVADQTQSRNPSDCFVALENVESWTGKVSPILGKPHFAGTPKRFISGDVLYGKLRPYLAKVALAESPGGCVGEFLVLRAKRRRVTPAFLALVLRSPRCIDVVSQSTFGAKMPRADWSFVGGLRVALPPVEEQNAIVDFLNNVNERIDKFIAAKRALISLLDEQRQSATDQALGSGAKGTRQVPLKSVVTIQSGITLGKTYPAQGTKDYSYMRVANVQAGRLDLRIVKTIRLPENEASRSMLRVGDVLVTEGGDPDKLGRGCIWSGEIEPCVHQNHIFAIRPRPEKLSAHFLQAALNTSRARDYFIRSAKQTTNLASTNRTAIGRFRVPLPDVSEQKTLLQQLEADLRPLAVAIEKANREIDLMKELQARLTADVVTGKLDIRNVRLQALNTGALDELIEQNVEEAAELDKESADQ